MQSTNHELLAPSGERVKMCRGGSSLQRSGGLPAVIGAVQSGCLPGRVSHGAVGGVYSGWPLSCWAGLPPQSTFLKQDLRVHGAGGGVLPRRGPCHQLQLCVR
ncbi:hypothetical protein FKM82_027197 [Ascaphus truei]